MLRSTLTPGQSFARLPDPYDNRQPVSLIFNKIDRAGTRVYHACRGTMLSQPGWPSARTLARQLGQLPVLKDGG